MREIYEAGIYAELGGGHDIETAAKAACDLAERRKQPVAFQFEGVFFVAWVGIDPKLLVQIYDDERPKTLELEDWEIEQTADQLPRRLQHTNQDRPRNKKQ